MRYYFFFLFCVMTAASLAAQELDALSRDAKGSRILRLHYQNDFYTGTDYYFTQGEHYEYLHPVFQKFILRKILINPEKSAVRRFGVSFWGGGYTPVRLDTPGVQINNRPFAAYMYFGYFSESVSAKHKFVFKSEIALGWIGPAALGKETQIILHRLTGSPEPQGWDNQVVTDLVVQYRIDFDKLIFARGKLLKLWYKGTLQAGTFRNQVASGGRIETGLLPDVFNFEGNKFFAYLSMGIYPSLSAYDALLQGGMFNRKNPHSFSSYKTKRSITSTRIGIILGKNKLKAGFFIESITPEFSGGLPHQWGNIDVGIKF